MFALQQGIERCTNGPFVTAIFTWVCGTRNQNCVRHHFRPKAEKRVEEFQAVGMREFHLCGFRVWCYCDTFLFIHSFCWTHTEITFYLKCPSAFCSIWNWPHWVPTFKCMHVAREVRLHVVSPLLIHIIQEPQTTSDMKTSVHMRSVAVQKWLHQIALVSKTNSGSSQTLHSACNSPPNPNWSHVTVCKMWRF